MRKVAVFSAICAITFILVEAMLRVVPGVIPLSLLVQFNPELSATIAQQLDLPTKSTQKLLARDDQGPPLRVAVTSQVINYRFRDPGSVNRVVTDQRGFCNPPEKGHRDFQAEVLTVGDSFTWCTAVRPEDTWSNLLSGLLSVPTYNLSRGGTGLYGYLQLIKIFGLSLNPKTVVMNVYEGNDLRDALNYHRYRNKSLDDAARPALFEVAKPTPKTTAIGRAYLSLRDSMAGRYSYAINLLMVSTRLSYHSLRASFARLSNNDAKRSSGKDGIDFRYILDFGDQEVPFNIENLDLNEVAHARALWRGAVKLADVFDDALRNFVGLSLDKGFTPVVTYTPSAYTAYAEYVRFSDPDLEPIMRAYSKMQREYFSDSATRFGYRFIDLTPALQEAARNLRADELLYFPTNVHYSAAGHRVVAEAIARALTQR